MDLKNLKLGQSKVIASEQTEILQEHDKATLDSLISAFDKFIEEEIKEKEAHDVVNLRKLQDTFKKFVSEEKEEA